MKNDISIADMLAYSKKLYELNKDTWQEPTPESNIYTFAWLIAEIGEVLDLIKKEGVSKIMNDKDIRAHTLEELADCYMYLALALNKYGFTSEEFSKAYHDKMDKNFKRTYKISKELLKNGK